MTTVADLIREINQRMHSWTGVREATSYLTGAIDADDLTFQVANAENNITVGFIEVDDELMEVESVEGTTVRILPFGRGASGSTATTHGVNARVTNDPWFPKASVLSNLQETVREVCPDLFQVKKTTFTWNPVFVSYELPADLDRILNVQFDSPGPWKKWFKAKCWNYNSDANVTEFPSGKSIEVYDSITSGFTVQVTYAAPYTVPTSTASTLASLGIQETASAALIYGTCWRLMQVMENSRLQLRTAEQFARQDSVPAGATTNLAKQLFAMYSQFRMEERKRLLTLNPSQPHYTR
jgi:hypothetical protein